MPSVVFDPADFTATYPQYADFEDKRLHFAFEVASLLVDNSEGSVVPYCPPDVPTRKTILYLVVCHLCELDVRGMGSVGTLSSASEGSVSASYSAPANADAGWFNQTQCGAIAWQLLRAHATGGRLYNGCFR